MAGGIYDFFFPPLSFCLSPPCAPRFNPREKEVYEWILIILIITTLHSHLSNKLI